MICACTLTNLTMLLPFCVTVMIFSEILIPVANGGNVQWNHIWLLWGVGIISALLVFLAAKMTIVKRISHLIKNPMPQGCGLPII